MKTFDFAQQSNFRDLGGIRGADGKRIRTGMFYRSCCPARMSPSELQQLQQLRIRVILDLRTAYEAYEDPDPTIPGMAYYRVSGMRDTDGEGIDFSPEGIRRMQTQHCSSPQDLSERMHEMYLSMVFGNEAFQFLLQLIQEKDYPVLFHCATGKDRTGALAMILLLSLGVSQSDILADYTKSNQAYAKCIQADLHRHEAEIHQNPQRRQQLLAMDGVLPQNGVLMLRSILDRYGSYENYFLNEYHLTVDDLQKLRKICLV